LELAFLDPEIDALLCFWGGLTSNQVLEHINFALIANNPKPLIGYSDVTSVLLAINAKTGLVTFNGPAGISFGKPGQYDYTWTNFLSLLRGGQDLTLRASDYFSDGAWWAETPARLVPMPSRGWRTIRGGVAKGTLIGGNLGCVLLVEGTEWLPCCDGAILFIEEDEDESVGTIERMLTRLRHSKILSRVAGLIVGRFPKAVGFDESDTICDALRTALEGTLFPVIADVDIGHTDPVLTLPIGAEVVIDADNLTIKILGRVVQV
jgi:muramoyltetrapeptide carboxypeptidase LdcA involved in peptidoglycan recycling